MGSNAIGEIPVIISGDYSQLQKDLAAAEAIARESGRKLGTALESGFASSGGAARQYSLDAKALIDVQRQLDNELAHTKGTLAEIRNAYEAGAVGANVLARAENDVAAASAAANTALARVTESNRQAAAAAAEHFASLQKMFSAMQQAGLALTAAVTVPIVGLGLAAVKMSEQLNQASISFTTMLGSAEKAAAFMSEIKKFALSTPFQFPELVDASKRMMALGFAAKDVIPTLRIVGDTVAAMGGGKEKLDGIILALGQMQSKSKVSAQEMNQLAERGVKSWDILAAAIGVSIPKAMKLAEAGAVSATFAIPALLDGMNAKFKGQMEVMSKTLTGVWSNFQDQSTFILADIGNALAPVMKSMIEDVGKPLLEWTKSATLAFSQLNPVAQQSAIAFAAVAAAAGPVLMSLGLIAQGLVAVRTAAIAMGLTLNALPWVPVISGAIALAAAIWRLHEAEVARAMAGDDQARSIIKMEAHLKSLGVNLGIQENLYKTNQMSAEMYMKSLIALAKAHGDSVTPVENAGKAVGKTAAQIAMAAALSKAAAEEMNKLFDQAFSVLGLKDTAKGVKELEAAFNLLKASGKLTADQIILAHVKIREFTEEAGNGIRKLEIAADKFQKPLNDIARIKFTQNLFPKSWLEEQKEMLVLLEKINEEMEKMSQAGLSKGAFSSVGGELGEFSKMFPELEKLDRALKSISGDSMADLAKDAKEAAENLKILEKNFGGVIKSQRDLDIARGNSLETIIRLKAATGEDATKQIVELDNIRRAIEATAKASQRWGMMILEVRDAFDQLLDAKNIIDTIGKAIFDTSENERLRDSIQDLTADLEDQAREWEDTQREASDSIRQIERDMERSLQRELADYEDFVADIGSKFEEIVAKHAESMQRIREDANRNLRDLGIDYARFVEDTNERIREAQAEGDAKEVAQLQKQLRRRAEDYSRHVADLNIQTAQRLADEQASQVKETENLQKQLEERTQAHVQANEEIRTKAAEAIADVEANLAKQKQAYDAYVAATTAKIAELEDNMTNAFERIGGAFRDMLQGFVTEVGKMIASTILQGYLDQIKEKILGAFHIPIPGSKTPPVGLPDDIENFPDMPGTVPKPSGGGGGGALGALGGMGTLGAVSSAVSAVSDVIANFQFYAMNKSLDIIVKHTLQIANDMSNLRRDQWDQQTNLFFKLDDMWNEIRNVVSTLQLIGLHGGGGGGGDSEAFREAFAKLINDHPASVESSTIALLENAMAAKEAAKELDRVQLAASGITYGQQAVTSSLGNLNTAVSRASDSFSTFVEDTTRAAPMMLEASEAIGRVTERVEKFSSAMFLGENVSADPNAILAGAIRPTVSPSGAFSPFSQTQGTQTQSSIAQAMKADVTVTAVEPSGRNVTKAIVTGLENIGVRIK